MVCGFSPVSAAESEAAVLPFGVAGLAIFGVIVSAIWFPVAYLLGKRYTERLVDFATTLYDSGAAKFGSVDVSGEGLYDKDPRKMSWGGATYQPDACDWMLLSALLRSLGGVATFDGEPSDSISAITFPSDFETWMKLDMQYIDNWSLALDWKILLRTIPRVLTGHGAN